MTKREELIGVNKNKISAKRINEKENMSKEHVKEYEIR